MLVYDNWEGNDNAWNALNSITFRNISNIIFWRKIHNSSNLSSEKKYVLLADHDDIIKWKRFRVTDTELWCSLWSASESMAEQTIVGLVIWDAIAPIMTSL